MKAIDLGRKTDSMGAIAIPVGEPEDPKEPKIYYPSLYLSDCPPELMGLEDGEALITFRVVSQTESKREGNQSCGLELEITSITPKKMPAPEAEGESDTEAAFADYENQGAD